jgi:hypothetical protein
MRLRQSPELNLDEPWQHSVVSNFGKGGRSTKDWEIETIRQQAHDVDFFWCSVPSEWESDQSGLLGRLTFSERCQEYDRLGFDCVEVHRGREQELFDSGEIPACSRENQDVIVGYFVRRSD